MAELDTTLRNTLERLVVDARGVSETAAEAALMALGVHQKDAPVHLTGDQRALRRTLRAKARQLGDELDRNPNDPIPGFTQELAYERWHQMLFASFLAHNYLLMHPTEKVSVSLQECDELAQAEGDANGWQTAARYASHMLPGIFRPHDPLLRVRFAPEHQQALERILDDIPEPTYASDDGLGWVYQFWQTKQKKEVNESGRKIGGADIAPVTQLFTEHYMVQFLLHNTLGAWWTARHPDIPLPTSKSYLRTLEDGTPAAGTFDGWPDTAMDITVMDPCCGSGHFLVAAFTLLQRFRMIEEGLSEAEAGDAVLRDNIHGLEIDPRCTQLAAFNLALHAWKRGGYRPLPSMNIACSGIPARGTAEVWAALADDPREKLALELLHGLFKGAPDLGSLINPNRIAEQSPLHTADFGDIRKLLGSRLEGLVGQDPGNGIFGDSALGIAHAAQLLSNHYTLVTTNVPFLKRAKHSASLAEYLETNEPLGKGDLAAAFLIRAHDFLAEGGITALVMPTNLTHLKSFRGLRQRIFAHYPVVLAVRLGPRAFRAISGEVVNVVLALTQKRSSVHGTVSWRLDLSKFGDGIAKAEALVNCELVREQSHSELRNSNFALHFDTMLIGPSLADFCDIYAGMALGDIARYALKFWEVPFDCYSDTWDWFIGSVQRGELYGGRQQVLRWEGGEGALAHAPGAFIKGRPAWGKTGLRISQMQDLAATVYTGELFDQNAGTLIPKVHEHLLPIYCFVQSDEYTATVKAIDSSIKVTVGNLSRVPFELARWETAAADCYPNGLPKPYSDDPSQWLFHGHPVPATETLQVVVARLLGYVWPAQTDPKMELSDEAHDWVKRGAVLAPLVGKDGIACLPLIVGEPPAAERLRQLLARAYADRWGPATEAALLATVGYDGKTLQDWLWGDFFKQHCKLFHNRPFIWHITDGLKDGFSALVNYHKLDRALLERLIYTYLGSWIRQQQEAAAGNVRGADRRLEAAQDLKTKLELILEGEPPYDIFVRWKALHEQPIGWNPDLNDGVRINIRPFVTAGVLRSKFTINWNKDRGNDPEPNVTGTTERHNDCHFTNQEKRAARERNSR